MSFPTNLCPWNVLKTNEQHRPPAYKNYLFLMCSVIADHLPDPANVVATAVQCENLNGATSLFLIRSISMRLPIQLIHLRNACRLPSHSKALIFSCFLFSLNTCFKMMWLDCWLLLCFSPSFSSLFLSHVNRRWFICSMN